MLRCCKKDSSGVILNFWKRCTFLEYNFKDNMEAGRVLELHKKALKND
jgi:hypothetical protein